jgi:hypothetical protein
VRSDQVRRQGERGVVGRHRLSILLLSPGVVALPAPQIRPTLQRIPLVVVRLDIVRRQGERGAPEVGRDREFALGIRESVAVGQIVADFVGEDSAENGIAGG